MLWFKETAGLYSLLRDGEKRPFQDIITDFSSATPSVQQTTYYLLVLLLEEPPKFLKSSERLVAFALLHHACSSPKVITEHLMVLLTQNMSLLNSMNVVERLTTEATLPTDSVEMYILKCLSVCRDIQDVFMQHRAARLVCFFLQRLIDNKVIKVQDPFIEVEMFCEEYSRIPEAAALLKRFKSKE